LRAAHNVKAIPRGARRSIGIAMPRPAPQQQTTKKSCFVAAAPWRPARVTSRFIPRYLQRPRRMPLRSEPFGPAALLRVVTKHPTNGARIMTPFTLPKSALCSAFLGMLFVVGLAIASAQAQATRTWVSGVGNDANPCSRTAPCKSFAGAISKTAAGGEIDALDPGGFGALRSPSRSRLTAAAVRSPPFWFRVPTE
jgi:hypothetical protein